MKMSMLFILTALENVYDDFEMLLKPITQATTLLCFYSILSLV